MGENHQLQPQGNSYSATATDLKCRGPTNIDTKIHSQDLKQATMIIVDQIHVL